MGTTTTHRTTILLAVAGVLLVILTVAILNGLLDPLLNALTQIHSEIP